MLYHQKTSQRVVKGVHNGIIQFLLLYSSTYTCSSYATHFGMLLCQGDCAQIPTTTGAPPADGLHVDVANGAITLKNGAGQVEINAGQFGYVANNNIPPALVPQQQGIQVTMPGSRIKTSKQEAAGTIQFITGKGVIAEIQVDQNTSSNIKNAEGQVELDLNNGTISIPGSSTKINLSNQVVDTLNIEIESEGNNSKDQDAMEVAVVSQAVQFSTGNMASK